MAGEKNWRRKLNLFAGIISVFGATAALGELTITFAPTLDGGTRVTAIGQVDTDGLVYSRDFGATFDNIQLIDGNTESIWHLTPGDDIYEFPDLVNLFDPPESVGPVINADSASGDAFGLYYFTNEQLIYFPDGFTSGEINGELVFENTAVSELGPVEQIFSWGPNSTQRLVIQVVPEPTSLALLSFGGLLIARRRRS